MVQGRQSSFGWLASIILLVILSAGALIIWRANTNQSALPTPSQRDTLEVKDWDTKFPQLPDHTIVLAAQRGGPAYGAAKDSITLYLPEFDDKFTCATDTPTPHKAIFATIAQYTNGIDLSGPYKPDAISTVGGYTYALYSAGANCYGAATAQVQGIFAMYAKLFNAKSLSPNAGYIVIKEWGVRFKPVDGLVGVRYTKPSNSADDAFAFTTDQIVSQNANCSGSAPGYTGLGVVQRSATMLSQYEKSLGKVAGYYYYYFGPQSACSPNADDWGIQADSKKRLLDSLGSLEAAR